jgi:hypothetical protein
MGTIKINRKEMLKQRKELQKIKVTVQRSSANFCTSQKMKQCPIQMQLQLVSQISNVNLNINNKALAHHTSSDKTYVRTLNVCHCSHFFIVFHNSSMKTPRQTFNSAWQFTYPSKFVIIILSFKAK